jgi:hypothetical protein
VRTRDLMTGVFFFGLLSFIDNVGWAASHCIPTVFSKTQTYAYGAAADGTEDASACVDVDGDGYGDPGDPTCLHSEQDCDDSNPDVNPGSFALLTPPDQTILYEPPKFQWNPGCFDVFRLYCVFRHWMTYFSVYRAYSFWLPGGTTSVQMTYTWWNALFPGYPNYWAVLGVNTTTMSWEVVGAWTFMKLE